MGRIRFLRRAAAVALVFFLAGGMALSASAGSLKEAQEEMRGLERELKEVQQNIQDLKESKGDTEERVEELNRHLMDISARITELENELAAKSEEIVDAKEQLAVAQEKARKQYEDMKIRIQFMYENGQGSYFDALLSSESIPELLNAAEYISEIQNSDRQMLEEYEQTVVEIGLLEQGLEADYVQLEERKRTVEGEKASVAAMMQQKEEELAELSEEISDAQSEASYYEAEIQAQKEMIAEIKRIEAEKAAARLASKTYAGGVFTWPCPSSTRVTSDYGPRKSPMAGASTNHRGIDIGAAGGADIVAAADGTVRAASCSAAAGNYVMIDHGSGLYTVYMHASALNVSNGQEVKAGQVIAKVGSTGISTGNHLHFGVSLNGEYVSPWNYLGR